MKNSRHAQPIASDSASNCSHTPDSASSQIDPGQDVQLKQCRDCYAMLPLSDFGFTKYLKDGRTYICKACRAQYLRLSRRLHYNSKSKVDDSIIRSVFGQNTAILDIALQQPSFTCLGFIPHTDKVFKVSFGKSRYDMPSMAIFQVSGEEYLEVAYSGHHPVLIVKHLIGVLKTHGIRLELDEAGMLSSKAVIYYV